MAKVQEEIVVIKLSKLVKEVSDSLISDDVVQSVEAIVQELVGDSIIVEVEKA